MVLAGLSFLKVTSISWRNSAAEVERHSLGVLGGEVCRQGIRCGVITVELEAVVLHIRDLEPCNIIDCQMSNSF